MDKPADHLKFIIQRYDNYISGANTKGNILLAFHSFLIGGIATTYDKLKALIEGDCGLIVFNCALIILLLLAVVSIVFVLTAIYPFLSSGNSSKDKYHSLVFFKSVAEFENDSDYKVAIDKQSNDQVTEDLTKQAFQLATGLKTKYSRLEWAIRLMYFELGLVLLVITLITIA